MVGEGGDVCVQPAVQHTASCKDETMVTENGQQDVQVLWSQEILSLERN